MKISTLEKEFVQKVLTAFLLRGTPDGINQKLKIGEFDEDEIAKFVNIVRGFQRGFSFSIEDGYIALPFLTLQYIADDMNRYEMQEWTQQCVSQLYKHYAVPKREYSANIKCIISEIPPKEKEVAGYASVIPEEKGILIQVPGTSTKMMLTYDQFEELYEIYQMEKAWGEKNGKDV